MKKNIYVKPETTVVLVETEAMMAAVSGPNSVSATFSNDDVINRFSVDAKGHDSSLWDFDDEY